MRHSSPHRRAERRGQRPRALLLALSALTALLVVGAAVIASAGSTDAPRAASGPAGPAKAPPRVDGRPIDPRPAGQTLNGPQRAVRSALREDLAAVRWRPARPIGRPQAGRLAHAVRLPAAGRSYVTWDPVLRRTPNRPDRRNGTARLVRTIIKVAAAYRKAHPGAARVVVGDLSRPQGGDFGAAFGDLGDGKGHVSHQNGLDVDIYLPRADGLAAGPAAGGPQTPIPFKRALAQDLVDRFVRAGATLVVVGDATGLTGPPGIVVVEPRHNDHIHVRLPPGS